MIIFYYDSGKSCIHFTSDIFSYCDPFFPALKSYLHFQEQCIINNSSSGDLEHISRCHYRDGVSISHTLDSFGIYISGFSSSRRDLFESSRALWPPTAPRLLCIVCIRRNLIRKTNFVNFLSNVFLLENFYYFDIYVHQ